MNKVELTGLVTSIKYSHAIKTIEVYEGIISVERHSGIKDEIPFQTTKKDFKVGMFYSIAGELRTFRVDEYPHKRSYIKVIASKLLYEPDYENHIELSGELLHKGELRNTPMGKTIIDFAVKVPNEKSISYPNIIAWGNTARVIDKVVENSNIHISGRLQSRKYNKSENSEEYQIIEMSVFEVMNE